MAEDDGYKMLPKLAESFDTDPIERNEREEEKLDKVEELQDKPETFVCEEVTPKKLEEITDSEKRHYESIERTLEELEPSIDVRVCG